MNALALRERYSSFLDQLDFHKLPEQKVVNAAGKDTYFIGSALTPNLDYFVNHDLRPSNRLYTQQRVFWTRYADLVNHSPVWTIAQVMMSYYLFEQKDLQVAFKIGMELLTEQLGLSKQDLYVILPPDPTLTQQIVEAGCLPENIVYWDADKIPPFRVDGQLEGSYFRFALKYRHGVLPIFDVVKIKGPDGKLHIDSCLLLERIAFVLQGKQTWYETEMFLPLLQKMEELEGSTVVSSGFAYQCASTIRSVLIALGDGADLTGKGKGHVIKRIIRGLLIDRARFGSQISLPKLVAPGLQCLKQIGYDWTDAQDNMESVFEEEEQSYKQFQNTAMNFLHKQSQFLQSGKLQEVTSELLFQWKDSRGIPPKLAVEYLAKQGFSVEGLLPRSKETGTFISDGYAYDVNQKITDPQKWLFDLQFSRR